MTHYIKPLFLSFILMLTPSCKESSENTIGDNQSENPLKYHSVGQEISLGQAKDLSQFAEEFKDIKVGDTVSAKIRGVVSEVCQAKGCWMKLNTGSEEIMVKFKDYGFFVPKDISGKEVVLEGDAFLDEVSVEDQKHYAMDEGKSKKEIEKITQPKMSFAIIANGVLIAEQ